MGQGGRGLFLRIDQSLVKSTASKYLSAGIGRLPPGDTVQALRSTRFARRLRMDESLFPKISVTTSTGAGRAEAPRGPSPIPSLLAMLSTIIAVWTKRRSRRHELSKLADRNDYLLADIGLSREQACDEAAKPFWVLSGPDRPTFGPRRFHGDRR
jgi:uncharacterized protein YjiS (DUF1127 family)